MKRIAIALALATTMLSGAAFAADEKPDYLNDKETYSCDKEKIGDALKELFSENTNPFQPKLIYVKEASEVKRDADGLRCRVTLKLSNGKTQSGFAVHKYEDGNALFGFKTK